MPARDDASPRDVLAAGVTRVEAADSLTCPRCWSRLPVMATAYGQRAVCPPCGVRWTRLLTVMPRSAAPIWNAWIAERR